MGGSGSRRGVTGSYCGSTSQLRPQDGRSSRRRRGYGVGSITHTRSGSAEAPSAVMTFGQQAAASFPTAVGAARRATRGSPNVGPRRVLLVARLPPRGRGAQSGQRAAAAAAAEPEQPIGRECARQRPRSVHTPGGRAPAQRRQGLVDTLGGRAALRGPLFHSSCTTPSKSGTKTARADGAGHGPSSMQSGSK